MFHWSYDIDISNVLIIYNIKEKTVPHQILDIQYGKQFCILN